MSTSASSADSSRVAVSAYAPYEAAFHGDAVKLLGDVNTYLPLAFFYHDEDRMAFYLRRISHILELKDETVVTREVKQEWIRMLTSALLDKGENIAMNVQLKILNTLITLFNREKLYDLTFNWKQFYDYLSRYHLNDSTRSIGYFSADEMAHHQRALVRLIKKARRYFVTDNKQFRSVGAEVLDTFVPFLSPFDNRYFCTQALIVLFYPTHIQQKLNLTDGQFPGATPESYHKLFQLYTPFTQTLIDLCPMTIKLNMDLYARMAKHALGLTYPLTNKGVVDNFVRANTQSFFSMFLQILELDIGGKHSQNMHRHWNTYTGLVYGGSRVGSLSGIATSMSKFIVYTLHYKADDKGHKSTQSYLTSLLYTMRTYVHPSHTSGRGWHDAIGTFLQVITTYYCQRLGREIRGEAKYDKSLFLDPKDYEFAQALQPIALQGLYSKSPSMISHCESVLRHLATFFPQLILPNLMGSIEQSMVDVNTSHRMMSSLQVMTSIANIAFSADINLATSGAAQTLSSMLQLSLPGIDIIDPQKTAYTMTWLALLFYLLPLVDARDAGGKAGNGSTQARLPSADKADSVQKYAMLMQEPTEDSYAEAVELSRTSTMQFEDWSLAYVDQLIKLLGSVDKFAKKDWADQAFARLLYKNSRAFFSAMSSKIFEAVSKKILKLILSEHHPNAQKHWGILIHTLSLGQTESFLKSFLPSAFKKLLVPSKNAASSTPTLANLASSELEWYVYLIGQAVKQGGGASPCEAASAAGLNGELLLPYIEPIQQIYNLLHSHENKAVRKNARKMLRNLLKGLTFTYPAEWRNFSPTDDWSRLNVNLPASKDAIKNGNEWQHWRAWGTYRPKTEPRDGLAKIDAVWHVPTSKEMAAAEKILVDAMSQPLKWLAGWIDGIEQDAADVAAMETSASASATGKGDTPLERNLQALISLVRGIQPVLGTVEGSAYVTCANSIYIESVAAKSIANDVDEEDFDELYANSSNVIGARCPLVPANRTQPIAPLSSAGIATLLGIKTKAIATLPAVEHLRTHLIRLTHAAFQRIYTLSVGPIHSQPSTKSSVLLVKLAEQVLTKYGPNEKFAYQDRSGGKYSRARLRELLSGNRSRLRPQLLQKLYDFHAIRMIEISYNEVYTKDVHELIQDVQRASINDFTKIRAKSTRLLIKCLRRFPSAIDDTLHYMLGVFSNQDRKASDENLLGCMGVLVDGSMIGWMSKRWNRMLAFIRVFFLYGESTSKDDKVQLLIQQLFNTLFSSFQVRRIAIPLVNTDTAQVPAALKSVVDAGKILQRNKAITKFNKKLSRTYLELATFLHQNSSGGSGAGVHNHFANSSSSSSSAPADADGAKIAHWRYSLMSAAFFFSLSRSSLYSLAHTQLDGDSASLAGNYITFHQYVSFFLKGLISTLAPLRQISFLALNKTLGTHTLHIRSILTADAETQIGTDMNQIMADINSDACESTPMDGSASLSKSGSILTFTPIQSKEEQLQTVFYDYLYSGWMADPFNTVVCKYKPLSDATRANIGKHGEHFQPHAYFTPLSLSNPIKFPFKPLSHTAHTPVNALPQQTLDLIHEFFSANNFKHLNQVISEYFVFNHPSLVPTNEGSSERAGDGAGDQIATLVLRNVVRNKIYPTTRFNSKSAAFDIIHVNLIRGLVELFPSFVTNSSADKPGSGLLPIIAALLKTTDEPDKACTAAEVLCGSTLPGKHFSFEAQQKLYNAVLPLWKEALTGVQPDCLDHFGDALRRVYTNMDPRRLSFISRMLFTEALNELPQDDFIAENMRNTLINPDLLDEFDPAFNGNIGGHSNGNSAVSPQSSPPSRSAQNVASNAAQSAQTQFKRLRFLLPPLIEVGFRGTKLGEWIVTVFKKKGYLFHPYKQVREEISWILFILTRNEFALHENHPAQSPREGLLSPIASPNSEEVLTVISSPVYLHFLNYIREQFDAVKELYRVDKNNPSGSPKVFSPAANGTNPSPEIANKFLEVQKDRAKHFIETVLTWLHATLVCGDLIFISPFYQAFVPYVLWAQSNPDPELQAIAKWAGGGAAWINAGGPALSLNIQGIPSPASKKLPPAVGVNNMHDAGMLELVQTLSLTDCNSKRAPMNAPHRVIDSIIAALDSTATSAEHTWHVRVAVAKFLQIWIPRHSLILSESQMDSIEVLLIDTLLQDQQIEVREAASQAFTSFVSSCFALQIPTRKQLQERAEKLRDEGLDHEHGAVILDPHPHIEVLAKKLKALVAAGKTKKAVSGTTGKAPVETLSLAQRHGGILGLSGLVLTHPYDLPSHLPNLLSYLAPFVEDRNQSVSGSLRKFFASFTSSHKDEWETFSKQFSEEQLEELQSMQLAPSYFA